TTGSTNSITISAASGKTGITTFALNVEGGNIVSRSATAKLSGLQLAITGAGGNVGGAIPLSTSVSNLMISGANDISVSNGVNLILGSVTASDSASVKT